MSDSIDAQKLAENMSQVVRNGVMPQAHLGRMKEVLQNIKTMQEFSLITTGLALSHQEAWKLLNELVLQESK